MLLAIDIGNTNVVLGLFRDEQLVHSWRLYSNVALTTDEYALSILALLNTVELTIKEVETVAICSVVPKLTRAFAHLAKKYFLREPFIVTSRANLGMQINYDDPDLLGCDRICNAVAAKEMFGSPVMIADFGTATSIDYVTNENCFAGGVIAPGVGICAEALHERTSLLPKVDMCKPLHVLGQSTREGMSSGVFYGYIGLVDGLIERIYEYIHFKPPVIGCGGFSTLIASESKYIEKVIPDLTLHGIRLVSKLNS